MRVKDAIINDLKKHANKSPDWDTTASLHERIQIEVLIDIRDIIDFRLTEIDDWLYGIFTNK